MERTHLLCLIFLTTLLCSCDTKKPKNKDWVYMDTINIPIDENYLSTYPLLSAIDNHFFYGYNSKLNKFDVIDLRHRKTVKSIPVEKEGNNGIPLIDNFVVHTGKIIIDGRINYIVLDQSGKITDKIAKDDFRAEDIKSDYTSLRIKPVSIVNYINTCYSSDEGLLFVPVYRKNRLNMEDIYSGPLVMSYNIATGEGEILSINYPEIFKGKAYYGNLDEIQLTINGDSLIYNFPNSSDVFVYNLDTKKINCYRIETQFTKNISETIDFNADRPQLTNHYLKSLFFHRIVFDKYRNLYYRLHASKCEGERFLDDRYFYLTVMDSSMRVLNEFKLPQSVYPIYHILPDGIMFQLKVTDNDDYFSYTLLKMGDKLHGDESVNLQDIETEGVDIVRAEDIINDKPHIVEGVLLEKKEIKRDKTQFPMNKDIDFDMISDFIKDNMVYPPISWEEKKEGIVEMLIQYDAGGTVNDYRMIYGCNNEELENEAWRIVRLIKKVKTSKEGGYGFPVVFNIKKYEIWQKIKAGKENDENVL